MVAVFSITLPVFAFIATGVLATRLQLLGPDATNVLNKFVVYLALPALLFDATARIRWVDIAYPGFFAAFGGGMALTFLAAAQFGRFRGARPADQSIQALGASFSNAGFMGIPLCRLALGEESLIPAAIATILTASVLFGCAIAVIESDLQAERDVRHTMFSVFKTLARNPLLLAPLGGAAVAMFSLPIPDALANFTRLLSSAATPCALVALGLFLAERKFDFEPGVIGRLVALKLLMQPAITALLVFTVTDLPPVWAKTALLMSALPTGTGPFILSKLYGRETLSAMGTILVSTLVSFATVTGLLAWFALAPHS
jgi:malonate transporter and related proteins